MMRIRCRGAVQEDARKVVVWDWKTGDLVRLMKFEYRVAMFLTLPLQMLNLSSTNRYPLSGGNATVTFLDEFRMMVLTHGTSSVPEFTIFDTFVPRNHPVRSRRFCVPQRYRDWIPVLHVDGDRCLGSLDRPLMTDPTQAILVITLVSPNGPRVFLIVRIQTLIKCVYSTNPDTCVPWEEWGRGGAVMELLDSTSAYKGPYLSIQGVRAICVNATLGVDGLPRPQLQLHTFDLSRRGWSTLPLWDEGDETVRKVLFEDGRQFFLQGGGRIAESRFDPLRDGEFMYLVSRFHRWGGDGMLTPGKGQLYPFRRRVARLEVGLSLLVLPGEATRIRALYGESIVPLYMLELDFC